MQKNLQDKYVIFIWNQEITEEEATKLEKEFLSKKSRKLYLLYEYQQQLYEMVKEAQDEITKAEHEAYETYKNTAGEIEARNTSERINLTPEERKNTRPDIDREDVVFADNTSSFSIVEPFVDENGNTYSNAVLLDTTFFDNLSPRNWGNKLKTYVEDRSDNSPIIMSVFDENGNEAIIQFAKKTDRISKNGGAKHKALSELYATNDNISKLSVIHIDEIIEVSEENNPYYSNNNEHGYFDRDGWLHRNANVINAQNGKIYNITIDIAKTSDGRVVLYATKGKIKKVGQAKVNSLKIRGSTPHSNSNSIPQKSDLSTDFEKNVDTLPEISKAALGNKSEKSEANDEYDYLLEGSSPQFLKSIFRMYDEETAKAKETAELYKENNKVLTQRLAESERKYRQLLIEGTKQKNI